MEPVAAQRSQIHVLFVESLDTFKVGAALAAVQTAW